MSAGDFVTFGDVSIRKAEILLVEFVDDGVYRRTINEPATTSKAGPVTLLWIRDFDKPVGIDVPSRAEHECIVELLNHV